MLPEVALKGGYYGFRGRIVFVAGGEIVTIGAQRRAEGVNPFAAFTNLETSPLRYRLRYRLRRDPVADSRFMKGLPREELARVDLAEWGDVGMGENVLRRDDVAEQDVAAEGDDPVDLPVGESPVAEFVARIDDLDADGARIDVGLAGPVRLAGVPGRASGRRARRTACRCSAG
jgi:hypothetical protein